MIKIKKLKAYGLKVTLRRLDLANLGCCWSGGETDFDFCVKEHDSDWSSQPVVVT